MASFSIAVGTESGLPEGSFVCSDPVTQYYDSLKEGETPREIIINAARDSESLRCVFPKIKKDGLHDECILDQGSQIVSMAKVVAEELGIAWNPDIRIHMQSANKQLNQTLGLARNVPFIFEDDVTVHLQVHVIETPAYRVLLGRPFDVVTESAVKSYRDGGVNITLTDPHTGRHACIPTFERGKCPPGLDPPWNRGKSPKFRTSMN